MAYIGKTPVVGNFQVCDAISVVNGQAAYTLQVGSANVIPESANHMIVSLNGVIQKPGSSFTVSGSTMTFASNLATGDSIDFVQILGNVLDIGTPSDATVTTAKLGSNAVTSAKLSYPLTTFSSTGIDDNADATAITIDSSERVGIGTASPSANLEVRGASSNGQIYLGGSTTATYGKFYSDNDGTLIASADGGNNASGSSFRVEVDGTERMHVATSNGVGVGSAPDGSVAQVGIELGYDGYILNTRNNDVPLFVNRLGNDGTVISIRQDTTEEGGIDVSGSTVSFNGFTGTHWSRFQDNSTPTILRGTVLESLDEMCDWYNLHFDTTNEQGKTISQVIPHVLEDGQSDGDIITYNHEGTDYQATITKEADIKHMKSKVSDTVDAKNVYGVFSSYDNNYEEGYNDFYVASVGSFVVRIKANETIAKGDLLQSNGDGTAKVQTDDNVKSSSFAKVLSTTIIETYEDGSFIVPCSLRC